MTSKESYALLLISVVKRRKTVESFTKTEKIKYKYQNCEKCYKQKG